MAAVERIFREGVGGATWLPPRARDVPDFAAVVRDEVIHVVETAGEVSGFVSVHVPDAFIHHLYIAPRFHRRGLASALLASLRAWLPMPWQLKCVRANTNALAFYAANGWSEIASGEGDDGPYAVLAFNDPARP